MNITDFTKDDLAVDITGIRNRHNDGVMELHDLSHFGFNLFKWLSSNSI